LYSGGPGNAALIAVLCSDIPFGTVPFQIQVHPGMPGDFGEGLFTAGQGSAVFVPSGADFRASWQLTHSCVCREQEEKTPCRNMWIVL